MSRAGQGCVVCGAEPYRANMCQTHYWRMRRHGHFDQTRPEKWGQSSKHPLWQKWKGQLRQGGRDDVWSDFWEFVKCVGEPVGDQRLYRLNVTLPWGPNNFIWRDVAARGLNYASREVKNAYMKEWRAKNHGRQRAYEMKRSRGLTIAEYDAALEAQNGGCAICRGSDGEFRLAIDHDHETGANRGLLCSKCNRGLGLFSDDPTRLEEAASYIRKWRAS
jgi:hypothetical protein